MYHKNIIHLSHQDIIESIQSRLVICINVHIHMSIAFWPLLMCAVWHYFLSFNLVRPNTMILNFILKKYIIYFSIHQNSEQNVLSWIQFRSIVNKILNDKFITSVVFCLASFIFIFSIIFFFSLLVHLCAIRAHVQMFWLR